MFTLRSFQDWQETARSHAPLLVPPPVERGNLVGKDGVVTLARSAWQTWMRFADRLWYGMDGHMPYLVLASAFFLIAIFG